MSRSAEELWGLLQEAHRMPYGAAQIAVIEQVIRHADALGDRELGYQARILATTAYTYGGEVAKSFVTFSWCLSDFDRDPAPFHARTERDLLWHFKYMVSALTKFPEVPLARTYAVLDDMERRYLRAGRSLQAVHKHRYVVARHVGLTDEADRLYERWNTTPRDDLSDCAGCDPSAQVTYLSSRGRDEEAVALAEPVLAGRLSCTEQPQTILSGLMVPYLRTGRLEEAADAHRRSYRLMRGNLADLWEIGDHVAFCARTGNENRGLEILQRHIDWLDRAPSPAAGMNFAASAALLLRRLVALGHGKTIVRRRDKADVTAAELADELAAYATALSLRFDARNGTTEQSRQIAAELTAEPYDVVLPLSASARRRPAPQPPPAPEPAEPIEIPADADADTLLGLAEEHELQDRDDAADAVLVVYDDRFGPGTDVAATPEGDPVLMRRAARRAMLYGSQLWRADDQDGTAVVWRRAIDLFAAAGCPGEASVARGRLGVSVALAGRADEGRALIEPDTAYQQEHGDARQRAAAWSRLALINLVQDRPEEANEAHDRSELAAAETDDPRLRAFYLARRASNRAAAGRHEEALAAAAEARAYFQQHGPALRLADAAALFGQLTSDPEAAAEAFGEVLAAGEPAAALTARLGRGRALVHLERHGEAIEDLVEAVALCAEQELDEGGAFIRQELAEAYRQSGRIVEAAEVAEEALSGLERLGHDEAADNTRFLLAGLYRQLGDNTGSLALYEELVARLADNPAGRGQIRENAGDLLFRLDRDAEAAEWFGAGAEDLRVAGDPLGELRLLRRRVMALHWADDVPAAEETFRLAERKHAGLSGEVADDPGVVWEQAMRGFEMGRLLLARGRAEEAVPYVTGMPERLREIGAGGEADQVVTLLGEALLRAGRPQEAEDLLWPVLGEMAQDAPQREVTARVLAEALEAGGHLEQAARLRRTEGVEED
ncbi:tetratricopeptide repeat protein [Actinoplanes sp. NPDC049599]|uniref:tetratricopeptide repeat protein n=1 Tax=Actinoplanes sp. NPDC049599 TaxID=3363903 RepID=UPI003798DBD7